MSDSGVYVLSDRTRITLLCMNILFSLLCYLVFNCKIFLNCNLFRVIEMGGYRN